jgi:choline kinase
MSNYKTTLQVQSILNLSKTAVNYRAMKLGFNRFSGTKRMLNDVEIQQIKNFIDRDDLTKLKKYSPKKIMIVELFLMNRKNTCFELSQKLGLNESFVSTTIDEYLHNNNTIIVASKL